MVKRQIFVVMDFKIEETSKFIDSSTSVVESKMPNCDTSLHMSSEKSPQKSTGTSKCHYISEKLIQVLKPPFSTIFCQVLCVLLFFGTLWGLLGSLALPGGHIFAIVVLTVCCYIAGQLTELVKLPPLLGMLIMGFILQNVPSINIAKDLDPQWSASLRSMALAIILLRAGLSLDPHVLRRLSMACLRLAFTPCLVECATVAISSHAIMGIPWLWGFILGFVIAAVSPAVVVPCMLTLQDKRLGVDKGIPTLITAAASVDDVLAITGFGVVLSITFAKGGLAWTIAKGPVEVIVGLAYGSFLGFISWFLPNNNEQYVMPFRLAVIILGGLFAIFGSEASGLKSAGALGCLAVSFIAAIKWRTETKNSNLNLISQILNGVWQVFQPILFGLIGAEIKISNLDGSTVGFGLAVVAIGIVFRMLTSFLVVFGTQLSSKEKLFVTFAWLPKATVQAAIGPVALDYARTSNAGLKAETLGIQVLTIAVLSILLTAPIGAAIITCTAPKLLQKSKESSDSQKSMSDDNALSDEKL